MELSTTDLLAIYAAVLSTAVFLWDVIQSRPKIEARVVFGIEKDKGGGAYIVVLNRSSHTVHLSNISFLYRYRETSLRDAVSHIVKFKRLPIRIGWVTSSLSYHGLSDGCPIALEARNSHHVFIPEENLDEMLREGIDRKIMACVQDRVWNNVYSNVFEAQKAMR